MSDNQITVLRKDLSPIIKDAVAVVVKDSATMSKAVEMLSVLNRMGDRITEEKEKVTKPLNEALKAERARWKPIEGVYEEAISTLRNKISAYQTAEIKRQREEEAKIAARVGEGKGKLTVETAVKKIESIEKVEESVGTDEGMVKFREEKVLKIIDEIKIPREYLVIDEKKLLKDLKEGKTVAGAELDVKMIPVNYR